MITVQVGPPRRQRQARAGRPITGRRLERQTPQGPGVRQLGDVELAQALAAHDEDALAELFNRYGGLAYANAIRIVGNPASAEDVVQEAFLKLWNNASHYAASRGTLRTWLVTAVRRRAIDLLRAQSRHDRQECELKPDLKVNTTMSEPSIRVTGSVKRTAVREALDSLPQEQRLVVELAYFGSYTEPEIAGMMGVALGTVKGRMRLGLQKLSSRLQDKALLGG